VQMIDIIRDSPVYLRAHVYTRILDAFIFLGIRLSTSGLDT
jgi:hypothetical protein